jgi:hypothetical protein
MKTAQNKYQTPNKHFDSNGGRLQRHNFVGGNSNHRPDFAPGGFQSTNALGIHGHDSTRRGAGANGGPATGQIGALTDFKRNNS